MLFVNKNVRGDYLNWTIDFKGGTEMIWEFRDDKTHLFRELDVILTPTWVDHRKRLDLGFSKLEVYRPATIDLILTKMARGDDEDLQDIQFLLAQEQSSADELRDAFRSARVPDVLEIRELFAVAQPKVLALMQSAG